MTKYNLTLPKMGESVDEATIVNWLKNIGDKIDMDDFVVEVATDKVDSEVPSDVSGILIEKCFEINDVVKVGETLCVIEISDAENESDLQIENIPNIELLDQNEKKGEIDSEITYTNENETDNNHSFLSPLVKSIIEKEGISNDDLKNIKGSGKKGRLTKKDLLQYLEKTKLFNQPSNIDYNFDASSFSNSSESDSIRELTRFEKMTSDHMIYSKNKSVHAQMFIEADITKLFVWREKLKESFFNKEKFKLTITYPLIKIVSQALREFPTLNATLSENNLIIKKNINIGIATALGNGNLIVPVIKNADQLSLVGICKSANNLISKARSNDLNPDDVKDGTFTITNIGVFESLTGTAIINQPQLGIIAFGSVRKLPRVIETNKGDFIGIRRIVMISLSFDHRIINGAIGGLFLKRIKELIENWDGNSEI
ncbi:MAG: 2-oxo acid dehydrogenase subunit E2 [Cryomorphaceae bacterium]|jgi:2-oxoglutarate dehydrogenase E2 component (dihydrolipoamide succinyltransferase)|nr:MAG: 2-oxo acid dehydrogenase subunit E2 [Cryomorphaceae bacterium]|tara:strand:+ start:255 stop:1538 length:1284 start_codon:yes stop_codon:yes gene_type:complete